MTISKGTKGQIAEYRVACALMNMNFFVYKNLSVNGPVDLLAIRGRRTLRVQVKSTLSLNMLKNLRNGNCDLLAVMVEGEIRWKALNRQTQAMVPGSILARRPKRQRRATPVATTSAKTAARKRP